MHKIFIKADRPCSGQLQIMGARSESMTNYRRLISYIYAYEGEVKGKNIGFAKLESRNGQCKLSVNVKKVYVGSSDLGVYLLAPGKEIFLGSIFIRSGGGEFRAVVNVENAADSGSSMDQCYGLTIHEQGDTWRAYTTIWEDAVAHAAEVELADVTSSKVGDAEAQIHRKVEELNQELRSGEKAAEGGDGPVLSSSPAGARQMSAAGRQSGIQKSSLEPDADSGVKDDFTEMTASHGAAENAEAPEGAMAAEDAEILAQTSEEVYQAENEANQMAEASDQAAEKEVGAEEILPVSTEADPAEMSQNQERQADRDDLTLEPELLPDAEDSMKLEPESLPDGISDEISDEMPDGIEEAEESGGIPDSQLESQSENAAESEITAGLGKASESENTAGLRNSGLAGITPMKDREQMDGMMMSDSGNEQEPAPRAWNGKWDFGKQQNPQHSWDEKNVTSIRKQLYEENESVPRELYTAHDPLNMGAPRQEGMVPDTRIPLQPDNMPENRTVPRPNIMTRPGMPRRHMPGGTVNTGASGGKSDQERMMDRYPMNQPAMSGQQPMSGQPAMSEQQPKSGQPPMSGQPSMPGRRPMSGQPAMSEQPAMSDQQPMPGQPFIPGQQPKSGQPPISGQKPMSGQPPMPCQPSMSNQQPRTSRQLMPGNQMRPSRQHIPGQSSVNQQPVPNRPSMSGNQPMPNQQPIPNQQPMPNQPPMQNQQPMKNRQPVSNQRPGNLSSNQPSNQPANQGRQSLMRPAGPEAGNNSEAAGQAEERVPVVDAGEETLVLGNPQELERLEQEEQQSDLPGRLWDGFRKRYPKIQAFDSANGCEILTIKPQDIGLLPRENWNYGNNSFLLHGYYNYRYLILARIGDETKGRTRYILGVPGNYYSNEKYMASMFGFPHFVLARKQPSQDGRFGYWYTDVRLENQD